MAAILNNHFLPLHFSTIAFVLSVITLFISSCYSINEQGRALLEWKRNLTSPTDVLRSWNPDARKPCSWFGVFCDQNGEVMGISLDQVHLHGTLPTNFQAFKFLRTIIISGTNISGPIPKEFGDYTALTVLDLSNNDLSGNVPKEIFKLSKLEELFLHTNAFEGIIPLEIGNLTNLVYLKLYDNNLNGGIPKSIGMLKKLYHLKVGGNINLKDPLPMEIGNCSSLAILGIAECGITGGLPSSIGMLKKIQSIAAYNSPLTGPIPKEIGNCTELQFLLLYNNSLSGSIPRGIGRLQNLQRLILWHNNLEGDIPEELGNCEQLVVLDLSVNSLTGSIPRSIGRLLYLQELQLRGNRLSGVIPSEISNCSSLVHVEIDNNNFTGEIPAGIGNLKNLDLFFAWQNQLTGSIPSTLSRCSSLEAIDLCYNHLSGPIPKEIFELKNLTKLILMSNKLSGIIPPEIGKATTLVRLRLADNRIGGTIPSEIGNLKNLNFFDASGNLLVGGIPPSLSKCENLQYFDLNSNGLTSLPNDLPKSLQFFDVYNNRLKGQINPSIGGLMKLTKLVLRNNQLSGKIPREIVSCKKLQFLDLGSNFFTGELPKELGLINSLEIALNLSCNQFSGEIPYEFSSLTKLGVLDFSHNSLSGDLRYLAELENLVSLNISNNNFSGKLPDTPFFQNLSLKEIDGNKGLYSSHGLVSLNDNNIVSRNNGSKETIKVGMSILISISALLFLLAIYTLIRTHKANSTLHTEGDKWDITMFQKLDFAIDDILRNLTATNVVGTGSSGIVYKVPTSKEETVAVKKMWSTEETEAFCAEIQILGSIRHKNIIKLLGWGSNKTSKLLFYDYLPNGDLNSLIHGPEKRAEWETRYEILLGVAHALAYLHHDCAPPISHGDVKTLNVLLGHHFEPYLADFGLARIVSKNNDDEGLEKPLMNPPQLAGSFGYMAPEQGSMIRATDKSDVYSFGVVILEVLTGRHPLDPTLPGGGNLVQWVHDHLATNQTPIDIFDSKLRGRTDPTIHEMLQVLAVGLICVSFKADDRPQMKDVVSMLEVIGQSESETDAAGDSTKPELAVVVQLPPLRKKMLSRGSSRFSSSSLILQSDGLE